MTNGNRRVRVIIAFFDRKLLNQDFISTNGEALYEDAGLFGYFSIAIKRCIIARMCPSAVTELTLGRSLSASNFMINRFFAKINPFEIFKKLWRHRSLIGQMTRRDVAQRYRGSYLGILWSFITPLLMLGVYTFVFSVVFHASWQSDRQSSLGEFALTLFAGLSAFNLFSEVINTAPQLVLRVPNYVKKVVFPLEILPVVSVASALVNSLIAIVLVVVGNLILTRTVSSTIWLLPLLYLPLLLFTLGLAWLLASLGVYVRDIGQGIGVVVQILFFATPVMYPISSVPEQVGFWMRINPLAVIVESFRRVLLWGQLPDWGAWGLVCLGSFALAIVGYAWFWQTKKGFADVL